MIEQHPIQVVVVTWNKHNAVADMFALDDENRIEEVMVKVWSVDHIHHEVICGGSMNSDKFKQICIPP